MCVLISLKASPHHLLSVPPSLWEVNTGEWKQEAQATVRLKRTAGIFSSGPAVPRPLFPPGPPGGYYCPLLCWAPWGNKAKLRKGPVNPDSFYIGTACQSLQWHLEDINTSPLLWDIHMTPAWYNGPDKIPEPDFIKTELYISFFTTASNVAHIIIWLHVFKWTLIIGL